MKFSIGILFVKFKYEVPILYRQKNEAEETEYVVREKSQKGKKTKSESNKGKNSFPGIKNTVSFFKESVFSLFGKSIRSFRLEKFHFKAVAASDDAAKTAELYGVMCTAGTVIHQFAENARGMKKKSVYVEIIPDFLAQTPDFYADIRFSIRIFRVLKLFLSGISVWQNYKKLSSSAKDPSETSKNSVEEQKE